MEAKKKPHADVNRMKPLFFQLGLAIALGVVLMAFNWQTRNYDKMELGVLVDEGEVIFEPPITEIPPPPKPKVVIPEKIVEVPDEQVLEEVKDIILIDTDNITDELIEEIKSDVKEEVVTDEPLIMAEVMPEPEGGLAAFYKYLRKHMKYPKAAVRAGAEGKVFVQFTVDRDGSLTDFNVLKSVGFGCDEEAIRVLDAYPSWKPGKQRGNAVKVRMVMPITFKIN